MRRFVAFEFIFVCLLVALLGCQSPTTSAAVSIETKGSSVPAETVTVNWFNADGTINWEAEKQQKKLPTNTVVIHHTSDRPGMTWQRLSEIQYTRLYVPRFNPSIPDPYISAGTRVQSGHFREEGGKKVEVFYGYHKFIRADGKVEDLLKDNEVGWHSGNWLMNCQSIGLCFDGNFTTAPPSEAALKTCARLIAGYVKRFPDIAKNSRPVIGHYDVKASTECPGTWFRTSGQKKLLELSGLSK